MAMTLDRHEEITNSLLNPDLSVTERTDLLQELRADYVGVTTDMNNLNADKAKLTADKEDLVIANSKMFRQLGVTGNTEKEKEQETQEFSETISLEHFEKL